MTPDVLADAVRAHHAALTAFYRPPDRDDPAVVWAERMAAVILTRRRVFAVLGLPDAGPGGDRNLTR